MENILLHVKYLGRDSSAIDFTKEVTSSGLLSAIQSETGCLCYQYYSSLADSSEVLLTEIWTDQDALSAHQSTENMGALKALKEKYGLTTTIEKFVVNH